MPASRRSSNREVVKQDMENREFKGRRREVKEPMTQHNFRMKESNWRALQEHFESKGLTIAQGIRMILNDYINEQRIR